MTRSLPSAMILVVVMLWAMLEPDPLLGQGAIDTPQTNLAPIAPPTYQPPAPGGYGQFDPYATGPAPGFGAGGTAFGGGNAYGGAAGIPGVTGGLGPGVTAIGPPTPIGAPVNGGSNAGGGFFDRMFSSPGAPPPPPGIPPSLGAPASGPVWGGQAYAPSSAPYDNPNVYGPATGSPYPSSAYPSSSPSTLFPTGILGGYGTADPYYSAYRLLRGPRFRYTYVGPGSSADDLETNDIDTSVVFAFPNFLWGNQPLYVVPSFSLHLWDGPHSSIGADLPSSAYSGFIDFGWKSDPNQMFGTEFGVRVGAFTDFDTFSDDSIRVLGKGLVHFRLTPSSTLKGGVYYLDRNKVKLLPAFGWLCQPNPYTRVDVFFPEPKYSRYCSTVGTKDVWWYVTGEYGGGSWTIKRADNSKDSIDINDLRIMSGFEFGDTNSIRAGRRTAFVEFGYVFDREVEYRLDSAANFKPDDAFLFRAGWGY